MASELRTVTGKHISGNHELPTSAERNEAGDLETKTFENCSREKREYLTCLKFNTCKGLSLSYFKLLGRQSGVCCSSGDRAGPLPRDYDGGSLSVKAFWGVPANLQLRFLSSLPLYTPKTPALLCTHTLTVVPFYF